MQVRRVVSFNMGLSGEGWWILEIVVTGGVGFIGCNLVLSLVAAGHRVRVLDNLSTGQAQNVRDIEGSVEVTLGDIRDRDAVARVMSGSDVVFHLAALPSVARSVADPTTTHAVNATGTLNVLLAARARGVRRVVFASSSSVYGDTPTLPKRENLPARPMSPYAVSKLAGENYCVAFSRVYGLETFSLRLFNVFGPRQDPSSEYSAVIPRFVHRMLAGKPATVFGDGTQSRDFTYVQNVIEACVLAATSSATEPGEVLNIACGERVSLLGLIDLLNDLLDTRIQPEFREPRVGDVQHSHADISRAVETLGYRPVVDLRGGLTATVEWFARRGALAG